MLKLLSKTPLNSTTLSNSYRLFNSWACERQLNAARRTQLPLIGSTPIYKPSSSVQWNNTRAVCSGDGEKTVELARQPVPELGDTIKKWLRTVRPLVNEGEYKAIEKEALQFCKCEGKELQAMLKKRADCKENWLSDWWLKVAYLDFRIPTTINVSPGLVFPHRYFDGEGAILEYTSKLIHAMLEYKNDIDNNRIKQEMKGKMPLDMQQYKKIFGTCRIPGCETDRITFNDSHHIIFIYNNNFYKIPVYDCDGKMLQEANIMQQLSDCIKCQDSGPMLGLLTSEHRTTWAEAYELLCREETNKKSLKDIETSLFAVCMDQYVPFDRDQQLNVASHLLIHGMGPHVNLANRWMDKTIQLVVNPNGITGFTYEHSPAEGQPVAILVDIMLAKLKKDDDCARLTPSDRYDKPKLLCWDICEDVQKYIDNAISYTEGNSDNLSVNILHFTDYGKGFIKKQKMSPDSYLQMAMQYAYLRMHCEPGAHYETAQQRIFLHGRTETIRSCSIESVAFARAMKNKKVSDEEKAEKLRIAVNGHQEYTKMASDGYGVDRHFLGLKMSAIECGLDVPAFLTSPAVQKSAHYRIATSQVALKNAGFMTYGPVVEDGYGLCYNPREDDMFFSVSSFNSCARTNCFELSERLRDALLEMAAVLTNANPKSKM